MTCTLIHGDCIEEMQKLIDDGVMVDMILTDPPYGTTACKWDSVIPFDEMWECINSLSKDKTPTLLFNNEPFGSYLRLSNIKNYRYDWVWNKEFASNFMSAKYQPLKPLEYISVFYKKASLFNPIRREKTIDYDRTRVSESDNKYKQVDSKVAGGNYRHRYYVDDGLRHPINLITFNCQKGECNNINRVHPTQKPVKLLEYLIKTYTNENDTVLDFTMGSGSTGVACLQTNRNFIGIELEEKYYNIAKKRCSEYQSKLI